MSCGYEFESHQVCVTGAPESIWLNLGDFSHARLEPYAEVPFGELEEVSWSDMAHDADDIEYVRADTVQRGVSMEIAVRLCMAATQACPVEYGGAVSSAITNELIKALRERAEEGQ